MYKFIKKYLPRQGQAKWGGAISAPQVKYNTGKEVTTMPKVAGSEFHEVARSERLKWFSSRETAAIKALSSERRLADYELGKSVPPPETAASMALAYQSYLLANRYCEKCPMSRAKKALKNKKAAH